LPPSQRERPTQKRGPGQPRRGRARRAARNVRQTVAPQRLFGVLPSGRRCARCEDVSAIPLTIRRPALTRVSRSATEPTVAAASREKQPRGPRSTRLFQAPCARCAAPRPDNGVIYGIKSDRARRVLPSRESGTLDCGCESIRRTRRSPHRPPTETRHGAGRLAIRLASHRSRPAPRGSP
jgi:hypothetical protein